MVAEGHSPGKGRDATRLGLGERAGRSSRLCLALSAFGVKEAAVTVRKIGHHCGIQSPAASYHE